jgi:predicted transposase YbfD/YdcC
MHFLNVYVANSGLVLYGKPVDKKTNEISAIPEALECLDIKGSVVTVDAMGCQKEIAEQIVNKGGNYVFGLKENQPSLHTHVREAFNTNANAFFKMDIAETVDKLHGREEIRKCRVIHNVEPIV